MIDDLKPDNERIWDLFKVLNSEYDKEYLDKLLSDNTFHKLSNRMEFFKKTPEGKLTNYGYIMLEAKQ